MFGIVEAILSYIRRQIGLRTDTVDNSSLHGKAERIKADVVSAKSDLMSYIIQPKQPARAELPLTTKVTNDTWNTIADVTGKGIIGEIYGYGQPSSAVGLANFTLELTIDGTVTVIEKSSVYDIENQAKCEYLFREVPLFFQQSFKLRIKATSENEVDDTVKLSGYTVYALC